MKQLADAVFAGDIRALARAATLIENRGPGADDLMKALFPRTGRALSAGVRKPRATAHAAWMGSWMRRSKAPAQAV